ncbi:MAG: diacylglycerol kinase [Labilithrix sp.]|nr:diacylglycerol kinase [Labilithrix sp.]
MTAGSGLYILVNANAKRGGRRVAAQIARALPGATVRLTRSIPEVDGLLRGVLENAGSIRAVLSAGGDGSAVTLLNALDRVVPKGAPFPPVGALPLGTGNAWAHALGARKLDTCVRALAKHHRALPTRRCALFECDGILTFFGGCGWDAQVLDDYRQQVQQSPSSRLAKSVWGYLTAMLTRTVPKTLLHGRPHVIIENLGDEVYVIDEGRRLTRLEGARRGTILYEGMMSVAGAATCPEFGYGFKAYPFAERLFDLLNVRVYDQRALSAVLDIPKLWRGEHPLRGMHDWFATEVRMTFSRAVPLQIGGEAIGSRLTVELKRSERHVDAIDWRMLGIE